MAGMQQWHEFTENDVAEITQPLQANGATHCPACKSQELSIVNDFCGAFTYDDFPGVADHTRIPLVVLGCDNCGHATFHSLTKLGLLRIFTRAEPEPDQN